MPKLLSDKDARRVGDMLTAFDGLQQSTKGGRDAARWPRSGWLSAKIIGWAPIIANAKWKYAWEEVLLEGDDDVSRGDPRFGTTSDFYALNMWELNNIVAHTGSQADGIPQTAPNYPASYNLLPIGGGTGGIVANQAVVQMFIISDAGGNARPVFWAFNAHHGACP